MSIILNTDSYKVTHAGQYPPGTTNVYSYFESRGGKFSTTTFFGLQYILEEHLSQPITQADIDEAADLYALHFGSDKLFNRAGWEHILNKHNGYLPLRIKAVPEGTRVGTHNVLMTVENTDPEVPWLTNYLETILAQVWYPTTVATLSGATRDLILRYLEMTGDPSLIDFKLHDFGFRGVSSVESAMIGGAAHLVNFMGTDTVQGIVMLRDHYDEPCAGFSVPASEHSTMTSWGREHEVDAYRNMVKLYGDLPFYSVVSDSYDLWHAAKELWGTQLKGEILSHPGTLVVRPDSGDPVKVVTHLLDILGERFGFSRNKQGYKVLNPKVRVIQGDGMNYDSIKDTLEAMAAAMWSADNVTFGMGGGLLQQVNRDTQKFAFKCSSIVVNGEQRDVWKDPVTDQGKVSKKGRLKLVNAGEGFMTLREYDPNKPHELSLSPNDLLQVVYEDGVLYNHQSLAEIRKLAQK